jgi:hypothetical protein
MADGELYNWMRSMQACHEKHIGGPPPLHRRVAYAESYSGREAERPLMRARRRVAAWLASAARRARRQGAR